MQDERPAFFLVIKEPPFPASYNEETYVARTLEEMSPSYSYGQFSSNVRLLIRRLPASPDELNGLITQAFPDADLDRTLIQSFHDTNGGEGVRVTIYKANMIEAEADAMDEAREILRKQIPDGLYIKSERVVAKPESTTVIGLGANEQEARANAQRQVPNDARVTSAKTLSEPGDRNVTIAAFSDEEARAKADADASKAIGMAVKSLSLASPGRKGFLGFGRTPNLYDYNMQQQAASEIVYTKGKARLVGVLARAEAPTQQLNADLIEVRNVDEAAKLLAAGADVNAKDSKGKTALMNASYYGRKDLVKHLLEHGADVNARYVGSPNRCVTVDHQPVNGMTMLEQFK